MPKSNGKGKAKKESKTNKLNRISQECRRIQEKVDETDKDITRLEAQYQVDATSRKAYQNLTYEKLSKAYDRREALIDELEQKQTEYSAVETEPDPSSSDESKKSGSSGGGGGSSGSSAPADIGWDCGCGLSNFTNPWGPDNVCGCGHQFCGDDDHCTVQWNP